MDGDVVGMEVGSQARYLPTHTSQSWDGKRVRARFSTPVPKRHRRLTASGAWGVGRPSLTSLSSLAFLAQGGSGRTMEGGW